MFSPACRQGDVLQPSAPARRRLKTFTHRWILPSDPPLFNHFREMHHGQVFHRMAVRRAGSRIADFLADLMGQQPVEPANGQTLPSRHGQPEPRLPHEHDESSDSHPAKKDARVEQAARDLAAGQQDTGRTPVVTELARKEFPSPAEKKTPP